MKETAPNKYCGECGSALSTENKFCAECGKEVLSISNAKEKVDSIDEAPLIEEAQEEPVSPSDLDMFIDRWFNPFNTVEKTEATEHKKAWYDINGWWFFLAFISFAIIGGYFVEPKGPILSLSEERAADACSNSFINSGIYTGGGVHREYGGQRTVKLGENEYSSVIPYTLNGYSRGYNCESIYLKDGKVWVSVYN